ncbi:MAG: DNA primase [Pseudomonadota bacterium]|jgi:hypothetical protein
MSSGEALLAKLDGVQGKGPRWRAICPAHHSKHRTRSLSIYETGDGRLLVHCFAGCDVEAIMRAVGLEMSDLFPARAPDDQRQPAVRKPWTAGEIVAALGAELHVAWVLLVDVANHKPLTDADRRRAGEAAKRCAALIAELG